MDALRYQYSIQCLFVSLFNVLSGCLGALSNYRSRHIKLGTVLNPTRRLRSRGLWLPSECCMTAATVNSDTSSPGDMAGNLVSNFGRSLAWNILA